MNPFSFFREKTRSISLLFIAIGFVLSGCGRSTLSGTTSSVPTAPTSTPADIRETATSTIGGSLSSDSSPEEIRAHTADLLSRFESPTRRWFYSTDRRPLNPAAQKTGWDCLTGIWTQGTEEIEKQYHASVREDFPLTVSGGAFAYLFYPREGTSRTQTRYYHVYHSVVTEIKLPIMGAASPPVFSVKQQGGADGKMIETASDRFVFKDINTTGVKVSAKNTETDQSMLSESSFGMIDSLQVPFTATCDDRRLDLTYQTPRGETTIRLQR